MERLIHFDLLSNHAHWIDDATRLWLTNIGEKWFPEDTFEATKKRFEQQLNIDKLPLATIAHDGKNLIGLCNIGEEFQFDESYGTWLGVFVVACTHQRRGIGTQLMNYTINAAIELGVSELYIFTVEPEIPKYYEKRGWAFVKKTHYKGIPAVILKKELKQLAA